MRKDIMSPDPKQTSKRTYKPGKKKLHVGKLRAVLAEERKDPFHVLGHRVSDFTLSG